MNCNHNNKSVDEIEIVKNTSYIFRQLNKKQMIRIKFYFIIHFKLQQFFINKTSEAVTIKSVSFTNKNLTIC